MILMSGSELAEIIRENLAKIIYDEKLKLKLAVILIGDNLASKKYVKFKKDACEEIGIEFELHNFKKSAKQKDILSLIHKLNKDKKVTGIIIQLPIPWELDKDELLETIDPQKDVDGLNSINLGKLIKGLEGLVPATPQGIINLLRYYQIPVTGKKVTVVGQSNLVGKPLSIMLLNERATVTVANSKTKNLKELTLQADIIISATGQPKLIKASMVKEKAIVVDVGTAEIDSELIGDVDFKNVSKKAAYITPNIGGIGPMTVAMLLSNVVKAGRRI